MDDVMPNLAIQMLWGFPVCNTLAVYSDDLLTLGLLAGLKADSTPEIPKLFAPTKSPSRRLGLFQSTPNILIAAGKILEHRQGCQASWATAAAASIGTPLQTKTDDEWSIPFSRDLALIRFPFKPSGRVTPITTNDRAEPYSTRELKLLMQRTTPLIKFGNLSEKEQGALVGDLWEILDQLFANGRDRDFFWIHLFGELTWGGLALEKNRRIAEPIIEKFLPWFERGAGQTEDCFRILSEVLKAPLSQRGYSSVSGFFRHLEELLPDFFAKNKWVRQQVIVRAFADRLLDSHYDYQERLPTMLTFLEETNDLNFFRVWTEAMDIAWHRFDAAAITRLEVIRVRQGLHEDPFYVMSYDAFRWNFFERKVRRIFDSGIQETDDLQIKEFVKMALMLAQPGFEKYQEELFEGFFVEDLSITHANIVAAARLLKELGGHPLYLRYRDAIHDSFEREIKNALQKIVWHADVRSKWLTESDHADAHLAGRVREHRSYKNSLEEAIRAAIPEEVAKLFGEEYEFSAPIHWKLLRRCCEDIFKGSVDPTAFLNLAIHKTVDAKLEYHFSKEPLWMIGRSIRRLHDRLKSILDDEEKAKKMIVEMVYDILRHHLFKGQENPERAEFVRQVFEVANLGEYAYKSAPLPNYPWRVGATNSELREPNRYLDLKYLELTFQVATHLGAAAYFLEDVKRELSCQIRKTASIFRRTYLKELHATAFLDLKTMIESVARDVGISI